MKQLLRILRGRVARNMLAWGLVLYFRYTYDNNQWNSTEIIYNTILGLLLATLLYINNLLLLPRLMKGKRIFFYIPLAAILIVIFSAVSTLVLKRALQLHPGLDIEKIIWIPLSSSVELNYQLLVAIHIVFLSLLIFVFTLCWYLLEYQKKQKELAEAQRRQMEIELAFLKNQLNPHFLFNTLNNLYGLAIKKSDDTADAILKLSVIMRYVLYESNKGTVSFEKEKNIMEAYIELERLRLDTAGHMDFIIQADKDYQVPPLLWMPVLENIFKHGARFITEELQLEFRCLVMNGVMHISARNKYNELAAKEAAGGIGLANLEKRLSLLYPGKYRVESAKENGIYTLQITIQLLP